MCRYIAVIDLGKSNSKVALVDTHTAEELTVITTPAATCKNHQYPCLDEQAIEAFIVASLRQLVEEKQVDAITVTTHGATVALVNAQGTLAMPVMDYEFSGIDELGEQYNLLRPAFSETGSPRLPGGLNVGAQLFWQATHFPEDFSQVACILTWPQYWIYKLCNVQCNDVSSLGTHTDLYNPHKRCVSSLAIKQGWSKLLPPTEASGKFLGYLNKEYCDRTGLEDTTRVYSGIHDSNASLVPHLLSNNDSFSVVSTGTWTICMSVDGNDVELDESRDCLYNVNAYGMPVASARFMGGRERELILQHEHATTKLTSESTKTTLSQLIAHTVQQTPMVMPTAVPQTGPFPMASLSWIGVNDATDHAEREMCVTLYLALMSAQCLELIGGKGPIYVEGPLAGDELYCKMLMATIGRPVLGSDSVTGTSIGAAMLIARPIQKPVHKTITLHTAEREWLSAYAQRWQDAI